MAHRCIHLSLVVAFVQLSFVHVNTYDLTATPESGQDAALKLAETVRALDVNGNGKVDKSELTGFAKSQGLSNEEVMADFKELDVNKDGALDQSEIGPLFGVPAAAEASAAAAKPDEVAKPASPSTVATAPADSVTKVAVATPHISNKVEEVSLDVADSKSEEATREESKASMGLDLVALEHDSQKQAGGVIASRLAQRAQVLLARSAADEKKAQAFDEQVRALRGNATQLAQTANEETRRAAREASSAVSEKNMAQLTKLQQDERKSEIAADEHREQARKAMQRVRKAQASLRAT